MASDATSLKDRRVVVTGGTGFLGSAVAKALLDAGASCDVTWHSESEGRHLPAASDRLRLHRVDVADEAQVTAFYRGIDRLWASVHVVGGFAMAPVEKTSAEEFKAMFQTNALTCFLCCREAIAAMRRSGSGGGRIVNTAARPAVSPVGGMVAYSTSKAAVAAITQSLAEEVKQDRILVNAILPSIMDTAANRKAMPNAKFEDWPKVEQVAATVLFLVSPGNELTSGALVPVYGRA
jgi:NAD(P)-dependent dehydrogenase (short-subunit alcohol dehydrogenase family)